MSSILPIKYSHVAPNWFPWQPQQLMTSLVATILDFQILKLFLYSNLNSENSKKTTFSDWNLQNFKIHCKVISIQAKIVAF